MTVLAIDPGLTTGWARTDGRTGAFSIKHFDDHGQALAMWSDWLEAELKREPLVYLAIERAWLTGGRFANGDLTLAMVRLAHAIAWSVDVARTEKSAGDVRKALIGRARRRKGETTREFDTELRSAVEARGLLCATPHAVDAAALLLVMEGRT